MGNDQSVSSKVANNVNMQSLVKNLQRTSNEESLVENVTQSIIVSIGPGCNAGNIDIEQLANSSESVYLKEVKDMKQELFSELQATLKNSIDQALKDTPGPIPEAIWTQKKVTSTVRNSINKTIEQSLTQENINKTQRLFYGDQSATIICRGANLKDITIKQSWHLEIMMKKIIEDTMDAVLKNKDVVAITNQVKQRMETQNAFVAIAIVLAIVVIGGGASAALLRKKSPGNMQGNISKMSPLKV